MTRFWVTDGRRDLIDEIRALVAEVGSPCDLDVMTGSVNPSHAKRLADMRARGEVGRLRLVVDSGFLAKRANVGQPAHFEVDRAVGPESVRAVRTHAKSVVAIGPARAAALMCSANLNANRSHEFYERCDELVPALVAVVDRIFAAGPEGSEAVSQSEAGRVLREAISALQRGGVRVHDAKMPVPAHALGAGFWALHRGSIGDFIDAALARTGTPARVWSSGINALAEQVHHLARLVARRKIRELHVYLPPEVATRAGSEGLHAALVELLDEESVHWVATHIKALLVEGPNGVVCMTGSANLAPTGALEFINASFEPEALRSAVALLEGVTASTTPHPPSDAALAKAREAFAKGEAPARGGAAGGGFGLTPSMLAVSDDWQPQGGLKASTEDLEIEEARLMMLADLHLFVRWAWPIINPGTVFVDNWHIQEACKQFAAFVHGTCAEITLVAQPPGTFKSTLDAQIGPVWGWLHYPHHRWGFASHTAAQSIKDSTFRRDLIAHPDFQRIFRPGQAPPLWEAVQVPGDDGEPIEVEVPRRPMAWDIRKGDDGKERFVNTATGSMRATATRARVTGDHFDRLVGDDLLDGADRAKPEHAVDWTFNVFLTRRRDRSFVWLNGQRLHPQDVIGVQLARAMEAGMLGVAGLGGTDYLCFPHHFAPADPDRRCVSSVGVRDRRTLPGELLWLERFPAAFLAAKEKAMGPLDFAAQYEQNTRSEEVAIFRAEWWQRFDVDPGGGWLEVSIDSSNWSERERADTTAITLCRIVGGRLYRLAAWVDRYTLPQALDVVAQLALEYPMIRRWHVEDKAGGRGFIQAMKAGGTLDGRKWAISPFAINAVNPQKMGGDLLFRADAAAPAVRAGVCYVKAGSEGDAFIRDCAAFPNVWPDDAIASWVQVAIDPEVSKQLGARQGLGAMPRVRVKPR